jgi:hypothetical protein
MGKIREIEPFSNPANSWELGWNFASRYVEHAYNHFIIMQQDDIDYMKENNIKIDEKEYFSGFQHFMFLIY